MEQIKKLLLIGFLVPSLVFAECSQNVQVIKEGQVANCDGFLFSDQAEKDAAQNRDDAKFYKLLSDKLTFRLELEKKETDFLQRRLDLYKTQADVLSKDLGQKQTLEGIWRFVYFGLGVLVTGVIASNVNK